jgi:hypothetical protein
MSTLREVSPIDGNFAMSTTERPAPLQTSKAADPLLTRREAAEFITVGLGMPLAFSTLAKLCALHEGPPVARRWGRRPLYLRDDLRAWAEKRSRQQHFPPTGATAATA